LIKLKGTALLTRPREALVDQRDLLREIMRSTQQRTLEEEITLHLNADPH